MSGNPRLTDDAVSRLPLSAARAELLEEIMGTTTVETSPTDPGRLGSSPRRRRWVAPLAAAAAVAAVIAVPVWLGSTHEAPATTTGVAAGPAEADHVAVDAEGWRIESSDGGDGARSVRWAAGGANLEIDHRPASTYAGYVEDRELIDYPDRDRGEPVRALGLQGRMWSYSATDHTAILEPVDDLFIEARADGLDAEGFRALLSDLRWVDEEALEALQPDDHVTDDERPAVIAGWLSRMPVPPGLGEVTSEESDPYYLGADVAAEVTCGWVEEYVAARDAGDDARMQRASDALLTSRGWPMTEPMNATGEFMPVVREIAVAVSRGEVPPDYRQWVGCD